MTNVNVAVHDGIFHLDDVLCAVLWGARGYEIVRTRDSAVIDAANVVADVGGRYDGKRWFDHHQRGALERPEGFRYSGAGLVWKDMGRGWLREDNPEMDEETVDLVHRYVDRVIASAVCGPDNGKSMATPTVEGLYPHELAAAVSSLNDLDDGFTRAMDFIVAWFRAIVLRAQERARARTIIAGLAPAEGGRVLVLSEALPWIEHVLELFPDVLYVVFENTTGRWMGQAVPIPGEAFSKKQPFPQSWGGLPEGEFRVLTGVPTAIFSHINRFLVGAEDCEGVMSLVRLSLHTPPLSV